jgi:type II secretory pathway component PulF
MKEYRYSAVNAGGFTVTGIRTAESSADLADALLEQGLVLLKSRPTMGSLGEMFSSAGRAARRDLREFTQHMATCLAAGIPAVAALADFQGQSHGDFGEVIADLRNDIGSGTGLDEAFGRHPYVFDPVYRAMIAAGQKSGGLDEAFAELVAYLEWRENLRAQTVQALIYPAILVVGVIGLFLLMTLFVLPRFSGIFAQVDFELPALTVRMLAIGDWMGHWWWLVLLLGGAATVCGKLLVATDRGAMQRDRLLLALPVLGGFVHKLAISRFAKTFAMVFGSGLDLLRSLDLVGEVLGNRVIQRDLERVRQRVATGESLTTAFQDAPTFPPLVQRLITVGEKTGSLDSSLQHASEHLDRELPRDLKKAFTVFEALIIAVLGVMVCIAALSLLMPIMQIRAGVH